LLEGAATVPITSGACPQERSIVNHKAGNIGRWNDAEYQAIEAAFLRDNPVCHYCPRPAIVAHHDEDWMYATKEAYYNPDNMTPACGPCHHNYRRGLVICSVCLEKGEYHYMLRGRDKCSRHDNRPQIVRGRKMRRHPCTRNTGPQRCIVKVVCPYSPKKAEAECRDFKERKVEA
jgi:hypothetical protein